jgi:hypothetical protein
MLFIGFSTKNIILREISQLIIEVRPTIPTPESSEEEEPQTKTRLPKYLA